MNLKNTIFILVIVVFLLQMFVMKQDAQLADIAQKERKPRVALSTFPLYDIAKNIAKGKIDVFMILPLGIDAHAYEPNPKQIIKLYKSDLVVYSGASLEPWISRLSFENKTLNMSQFVDLIEMQEDAHHDAHEHTHQKEKFDPHYWLSIANMKKATKKITQEMIALDAQNKSFFLKNQERYLSMLESLDAHYKKTLSSCQVNKILTNHNAFSYLAKSYGFEVMSLSKLSPDAQTNAKSMIKLIKKIRQEHIATIFYESFASSQAIRSLAQESGVSVEVLQPLANITADEQKAQFTYEDIMRQNLVKISKAMRCQ